MKEIKKAYLDRRGFGEDLPRVLMVVVLFGVNILFLLHDHVK